MTNDIASELALLHTLKGSAYVNQLKAIAGRKEFHPLEEDPCIYTVGGENGEDYPFLLNPNRSLGPISSGDVKVFSCSPESKECLPLIYGSHKT